MKKSYHWRAILLAGFLCMFFSCDKEEITGSETGKKSSPSELSLRGDETIIVSGPEVPLGSGTARSWISLNKFQVPLEIGVEMTPGVFDGLPDDGDFHERVIIPLPEIALQRTPFNHIEINWSPENYSAIEGFDLPHFDFHFYMITEEQRMQIPKWTEETEVYFANYPPKDHMPVDYDPVIKADGSYEFIGRYWLQRFPENEKIVHSMVLGTYDGAFIFISPVSSLEFLKFNNKASRSFTQPLLYPTNELFPREYNIYVNKSGNYCISLSNFIRR